MDILLRNRLAGILRGKYGDKFDDWWYNNVTAPLMSMPNCPSGDFIGFGKPKRQKRKRKKAKKTRRRPKLGIVGLCKEAKEFLIKFDERVKDIPECDFILFAEVSEGEGVKVRTEYQQFLTECLKTVEGSQKEKFKKCALKWRELKQKKGG